MHLLLTDRLTCSRCGPRFGLILQADRMADRIVFDGVLGCPNCRDAYPVHDGFGDLRAPPRVGDLAGRAGPPAPSRPEDAGRLAALLGVAQGPGTLALVGRPARYAGAIAGMVEGIQVVAVDGDMAEWPEEPGVSRIASRPGLPFYADTLRAVAVDGGLGADWVREASRVVARLGRVVVTEAKPGTEDVLVEGGLTILASEHETIVAARD